MPIMSPAFSRVIEGSIVLVGHSYGGAVITNAVNDNENVKALVYVAAFAPDAGETAIELSGRYPGSTLGPTLAPPVELPDGGKDLYIQQDKFHAQFAADVPVNDTQLMASTQRATRCFNGTPRVSSSRQQPRRI